MDTITKSDFLYMVENQRLEVLTQAQLQRNTGAVQGFIQKALTTELTDIEKAEANQLIIDVGSFDCWCVLRDDFTKAVVYTRPAQVEWTDAEQGEFGEIVKAKAGVYRNTAENRKLGRVGQKYGEAEKPKKTMIKPEKKEPSEDSFEKESVLLHEKHNKELKDHFDKLDDIHKMILSFRPERHEEHYQALSKEYDEGGKIIARHSKEKKELHDKHNRDEEGK